MRKSGIAFLLGVVTAMLWVRPAQAGADTLPVDATRIQAPYGLVRLDPGIITDVALEKSGSGTVQTTNGTRISGVLADPTLQHRFPSGAAHSAKSGKGASAPFNEAARLFLVMTNGDYLSGLARDGGIAVTAAEGVDAGSLRDMRAIRMTGGAEGETGITVGSGGSLGGTVDLAHIALALEASPAIKLYDRREPATGRGGESATLQRIRMNDSRMVGYCVNDTPDGVYIRNVTKGYPASIAGLQVGDWVAGIDGHPIARGAEVWTVRDEITAGRREHLLLEIRRGAVTHWFLLTE